jgi:class 3 adenylate cyclase
MLEDFRLRVADIRAHAKPWQYSVKTQALGGPVTGSRETGRDTHVSAEGGAPHALAEWNLTFLLTDIENSTRLWDLYPAETRQAAAVQDRVIGRLVAEHGGTLVRPRGEGDSRFAVFHEATAAVAAAGAIQVALQREKCRFPSRLAYA